MKPLFQLLVAVVLFSSCTTLSRTDIQRLASTPFDPLILQPTYELQDFRLDIIRQKDSDMTDSTSITTDTPYHPLGFSLGNGLFFDLHENLSFDILALMDAKKADGVSVLQSFKKNGLSWRKINFSENAWCSETQRLFKRNRCYELETKGNEVNIYRKEKLRYTILNEPDSVLLFNRRGKVRDQIVKTAAHTFLEGTRRRKDQFKLQDKLAELDNYLVSMNEAGTEIQILRQRKKNHKLIYRIVRDEHTIYVYNRVYRGYKIALAENELTVFRNQKKLYSVSVLPAPDLTSR